MTDFAPLLQPDRDQTATPIHLVDKAAFEEWAKGRPSEDRALLSAHRFDGKDAGAFVILPRPNGSFEVVVAVKDAATLGPWCLAKLGGALPAGAYKLSSGQLGQAGLGWLLAQHRFEGYKSAPKPPVGDRILLTDEPARIDEAVRLARATALVRDLVDTPANDLGPAELEAAAKTLADEYGGQLRVTKGDDLAQQFPMVQAVGQAATADRAPRMIEVEWGNPDHPRVAIVGKGVCFDSGGLDIKPASGMRLMKKDMGGAAHALACAQLIASARLPVRLHLLIPAVENAVSGSAFRPGDIIRSRQGLTVEIDNTDAEGRLILGDALTRAAEEKPQLVVDFATLTGAARIALGPDLPAMFANDEALAGELEKVSTEVFDPVWRLPLWDGYEDMLKSDVADIVNSGGAMAGTITAALFLRRFVPGDIPWVHLDTFAWSPTAKPGRPKGGDALGLRAVFSLLQRRFAQP
ncbi:leucyl aminopeptidase family protein [Sphingomonas piscis]|uniref:Leucyl aminopeptidase family protein n=1 Tax=Sphingomonas piscis TaxID=2714943 RepID=A0A6G7YS27_9SPHN|nr:leucyl aminopeptidase family protein [Sphingomonas piscis]QIK79546.1 leucyl aminopeptidase family protein [Sphingomonas piscis]